MKLITLRTQALEVMDRWRKQYPDPSFTFADGKTVGERTKFLEYVDWHTIPERWALPSTLQAEPQRMNAQP